MKTIISSIVCLALAFVTCSAQVNSMSELRDTKHFSRICVNGNFEVTILDKVTNKIMVKANSDAIKHVVVEFKNDALGIYFEDGYNYTGSEKISVTIPYCNNLSAIYATDEASVKTVGTLNVNDLNIGISDYSSFDGCIEAKRLNLNIAENSFCKICGEVKNCSSYVDAGSFVENSNLMVLANAGKAKKAKNDVFAQNIR